MSSPAISGFTFVRNAVAFDYPLRESLLSLLPLCDELVIAVGDSNDGTLDLVRSLGDERISIIETVWDESKREGGRVLAEQTDIALAACRGDWCVYLQADEVLHEDDTDTLRAAIDAVDSDREVEALLMQYLHFYGTYDFVGAGRQWYRNEIRAVRNTRRIASWGDAQGFRRRDDNGSFVKLKARRTDVRVFHYGWVKDPKVQATKQRAASRYWHDDDWIAENLSSASEFDYASAYELQRFNGSHPAVMSDRIAASTTWAPHFDPTRLLPKPMTMRVTDWIESFSGWRIGEYRNFIEA